MILKIRIDSEEPIYRQIYRQLITGIACGALRPGDTLAPVRQLAADLGVNLHTVAKAYGLLKQEGYLHNNRQKGMTVAETMPPADEGFLARAREAVGDPAAEAICRGVGREDFLKLCAAAYDELKGES